MMRRFVWAVSLFAVGLPSALAAQLRVGVLAIGVSSTARVTPASDLPNPKNRTGYGGGLSLGVPLVAGLSLEPEALYLTKGVKATVTNSSATGTANVKLTTIEIPVLLRWTASGGAFRPTVAVGATYTANQKCKNHLEVTVGTTTTRQDQDCGTNKDGVTSTDCGAMADIGVVIGPLSVTARYDLGLKNIRDNPTAGQDVRNRAFLLVVGVSH